MWYCLYRYRRFSAAIRLCRTPQEEEIVSNLPEVVLDTTAKDDNIADTVSFHSTSSTISCQPMPASRTEQLYTFTTNDYMSVKSFETRDYEYLRFMSKFQQVQKYQMNSMVEKRMCAVLNHTHSRYVSLPGFLFVLLFVYFN